MTVVSRRIAEAVAVGVLGGAVGFATGYQVGGLLGGSVVVWGVAAAVPACVNGVFSGVRRIYSWRTPGGWLAFLLDSSWALISTTLGVILNIVDTVRRDGVFSPEFSVRRNRQVFGGGFALKRGFAHTQGNVVGNATLGRGDRVEDHRNLVERHEGLHVWQQRWFGPVHPAVYVFWGIAGALVATVYGLASRKRRLHGVPIRRLVETAAYYDNPFEYWAYRNDGRWEKNSAHTALKWGAFTWRED